MRNELEMEPLQSRGRNGRLSLKPQQEETQTTQGSPFCTQTCASAAQAASSRADMQVLRALQTTALGIPVPYQIGRNTVGGGRTESPPAEGLFNGRSATQPVEPVSPQLQAAMQLSNNEPRPQPEAAMPVAPSPDPSLAAAATASSNLCGVGGSTTRRAPRTAPEASACDWEPTASGLRSGQAPKPAAAASRPLRAKRSGGKRPCSGMSVLAPDPSPPAIADPDLDPCRPNARLGSAFGAVATAAPRMAASGGRKGGAGSKAEAQTPVTSAVGEATTTVVAVAPPQEEPLAAACGAVNAESLATLNRACPRNGIPPSSRPRGAIGQVEEEEEDFEPAAKSVRQAALAREPAAKTTKQRLSGRGDFAAGLGARGPPSSQRASADPSPAVVAALPAGTGEDIAAAAVAGTGGKDTDSEAAPDGMERLAPAAAGAADRDGSERNRVVPGSGAGRLPDGSTVIHGIVLDAALDLSADRVGGRSSAMGRASGGAGAQPLRGGKAANRARSGAGTDAAPVGGEAGAAMGGGGKKNGGGEAAANGRSWQVSGISAAAACGPGGKLAAADQPSDGCAAGHKRRRLGGKAAAAARKGGPEGVEVLVITDSGEGELDLYDSDGSSTQDHSSQQDDDFEAGRKKAVKKGRGRKDDDYDEDYEGGHKTSKKKKRLKHEEEDDDDGDSDYHEGGGCVKADKKRAIKKPGNKSCGAASGSGKKAADPGAARRPEASRGANKEIRAGRVSKVAAAEEGAGKGKRGSGCSVAALPQANVAAASGRAASGGPQAVTGAGARRPERRSIVATGPGSSGDAAASAGGRGCAVGAATGEDAAGGAAAALGTDCSASIPQARRAAQQSLLPPAMPEVTCRGSKSGAADGADGGRSEGAGGDGGWRGRDAGGGTGLAGCGAPARLSSHAHGSLDVGRGEGGGGSGEDKEAPLIGGKVTRDELVDPQDCGPVKDRPLAGVSSIEPEPVSRASGGRCKALAAGAAEGGVAAVAVRQPLPLDGPLISLAGRRGVTQSARSTAGDPMAAFRVAGLRKPGPNSKPLHQLRPGFKRM